MPLNPTVTSNAGAGSAVPGNGPADPAGPPTRLIYWAGPVLIAPGDRGAPDHPDGPDAVVPALLMWARPEPGAPEEPTPTAELRHHGFVPVRAADPRRLRRLPRLPGATIGLTAQHLRISRGATVLFEAPPAEALPTWRAAVRAQGGLALLVDTAPPSGPAEPDLAGADDQGLADLATARLLSSVRAGTLFGARADASA